MIFGGGTACVSPTPDAPEAWAGLALPSAFGGGGSSTNIPAGAGWLADFNDATLNALVREAMTNNPDLRVTAARLCARPGNTWDGTIISKDGVHPSGGKTNLYSEINLKTSGYALRNWVNFLILRRLHFRVFEH